MTTEGSPEPRPLYQVWNISEGMTEEPIYDGQTPLVVFNAIVEGKTETYVRSYIRSTPTTAENRTNMQVQVIFPDISLEKKLSALMLAYIPGITITNLAVIHPSRYNGHICIENDGIDIDTIRQVIGQTPQESLSFINMYQ